MLRQILVWKSTRVKAVGLGPPHVANPFGSVGSVCKIRMFVSPALDPDSSKQAEDPDWNGKPQSSHPIRMKELGTRLQMPAQLDTAGAFQLTIEPLVCYAAVLGLWLFIVN